MMLVSWSLLALSAVLPSAVITVNGDAICPLPSDVAARLSSLLPGASAIDAGASSESAADGGDVARIDKADDALEIVLRKWDGTLIGRRRLLAEGPCAERARAVAIVLATWESDVHPAFRGPVPQPAPTPVRPGAPAVSAAAPATAAARPAVPAPAPVPAPIATPAPPQPPANAVVALAPAPEVRVRPRAAWDLGLGVSSSLAGGALVVGGQIVGAVLARGGLGAHLSVSDEGERSTAAGSGQAVWSRLTAGVGPTYRRRLGVWAVDANLSFVMGRFQVRGQNYPVTYTSSGFDGAVSGGLRFLVPGAAWRPWLTLDATRWLDVRSVRDAVSGQESDIPSWSAAAALGVSFFAH